jgi:PAS domain-containing protein
MPSKIVSASDLEQFCETTMSILAQDSKDVMAAMIYTLEKASRYDSVLPKTFGPTQAILHGSLGIPENHPLAPKEIKISQRQVGLMRWFQESERIGDRVVLRAEDGTLPPHLFEGIYSSFQEVCRGVVICPLRQGPTEPIFGWIVYAANPRTVVNSQYLQFAAGLAGLVSAALISLISLQDEIATRTFSQEQAEFQKTTLSQKLQETEMHVKHQERILLTFVEHSSMGIFIFSPQGEFIYRNRRFNEIYHCENDTNFTLERALKVYTDPEFVGPFQHELGRIFTEKQSVTFELRLQITWNPNDENDRGMATSEDEVANRVWVIASAFPELDPEGEITQVLGCVTDISALKYSNFIQERRTTDAIESKQRLENFIDSTNHELRNPLSAVILAGDDILSSVQDVLRKYPSSADVPDDIRDLLNSLSDNGRTIIQCAKHQKRIVDDILTASKVDSNLVEVCPTEVDPEQEVHDCIRMFDGDAQEANVAVTFKTSQRYHQFIDTLLVLDATRFIQVFINLLTNAIKFTRFERIRKVDVYLDVSTENPRESLQEARER